MSFGWSGSDVFLLTQLAWNITQNTRKACGEYDELTRETFRLHAILQRLEQEVAKPNSPINRPGDTSKQQLEHIASDCGHVLEQLDKIVAAYAALTEEKRSARKIYQKVRFGNGQMADLSDLRLKIILYTSEMQFYMNLVTMGTVGEIEQQMTKDGGVLNDIKIAVEKKTAHSVLSGANVEGSMMTRYNDDDTSFWRSLRRELVKEGLPSAALHKHKNIIKEYVKELGARGVLDDDFPEKNEHQHDSDGNSEMLKKNPAPCIDPERVQCIVCLSDDVPIIGTALLPCKHRWCNPCLSRIFTLSTIDPQHMPPTCCTKRCIDLEHVKRLFNSSFKRKWNRKYKEFLLKTASIVQPAAVAHESNLATCTSTSTQVSVSKNAGNMANAGVARGKSAVRATTSGVLATNVPKTPRRRNGSRPWTKKAIQFNLVLETPFSAMLEVVGR